MTQQDTYTAGQVVDVHGTQITLICRKGFRRDSAARWSWAIPAAGVYSEVARDTAEKAIEHARTAIASPACRHGDPVMICANCFHASLEG